MRQTHGLFDLTGDGIPDYVANKTVRIGTGMGFKPPVGIVTSGDFDISTVSTWCGGQASWTVAALMDVDGDGRPEITRSNGASLQLEGIVGATGGLDARDAGRLIKVDNGYGGATRIAYDSAKRDTRSEHRIPSPEIVVTEVTTTAEKGLSDSLAPVRFAYGGAQLEWNPVSERWAFPGYKRTVSLNLESAAKDYAAPAGTAFTGVAVIEDRYAAADFASVHEAYALSGRPKNQYRLVGSFAQNDPWLLIDASPANDTRWHAGTQYSNKLLPLQASGTPSGICAGIHPYKGTLTGFDACTARGVSYRSLSISWVGDKPLGYPENTWSSTEVLEVDYIARPKKVKSVAAGEPAICREFAYAGSLSDPYATQDAVAMVTTTNCATSPVIYARAKNYFDGNTALYLASKGLLTEQRVEVRDTTSGTYLGEFVLENTQYDLWGNVARVDTSRSDDGGTKTKTVIFEHDPFEYVIRSTTETASGVSTVLTTTLGYDEATLLPTSVTDANGIRSDITYDTFGRRTKITLTEPGGTPYLLSSTEFIGDDPATDVTGIYLNRGVGRRVKTTVATKWKPANTTLGPLEKLEGIAYLDEFGRGRFVEQLLGSDYGSIQALISGYTLYDGFGRTRFVADTFTLGSAPSSQYGSTYFYSAYGRSACSIRGTGVQTYSATSDASQDRYVSCITSKFTNYRAVAQVKGPNETTPGMPEYGAWDESVATGRGRVESVSRWLGTTRLEHTSYTYDYAGNLRTMNRYKTPASLSGVVSWTYTYDSLGRLTQLQEPGMSAHYYAYDSWGLTTSDWWFDGTIKKINRFRYDGFGRRTRTETARESGGLKTVESYADFGYDVTSGDAGHRDPTYLVGRLSWSNDGAVKTMFGYDRSGGVRSTSWRDVAEAKVYSQVEEAGPSGALQRLTFYLPDTGAVPEQFNYLYDTAGRLEEINSPVTGAMPLFLSEGIDPFGRYSQVRYGNDVAETWTYRAARRQELLSYSLLASGGHTRRFDYVGYDGEGRLKQRTERTIAPGTSETYLNTSFTYDTLGRLSGTSQNNTKPGVLGTTLAWATYSYDGLGTMTQEQKWSLGGQVATTTYESLSSDPDRLCKSYTQLGSGWVFVPLSCTQTYDGAGNATSIGAGTNTLTYDAMSRVTSIKQGTKELEYTYGAFGEITKVDQLSGTTVTKRDRRFGGLIEESLIQNDSTGATQPVIERRIPGPGGVFLILRRMSSTELVPLYIHRDGQADRWFTDENGALVQEVKYDDFGQVVSDSGVPKSPTSSKCTCLPGSGAYHLAQGATLGATLGARHMTCGT
jgi:YD repeat-containing protein